MADKKTDLKELIARGICASRWRLRRWEAIPPAVQNNYRKIAERTMKEFGIVNMTLKEDK